MTGIWSAVLVLGITGAIFAVVLYFVAQKFKVVEDPLIDEVAEALPGANCGGCGRAGCRAMAEAFVKQGNMEGLSCPAGGAEVAKKVAAILGCTPEEKELSADGEVIGKLYALVDSTVLKQREYQLKSDAAILEMATNSMKERLNATEEILRQDRAMRRRSQRSFTWLSWEPWAA